MARPKKGGKRLSILCDKEVFDATAEYCEKTGRTKTIVVEMALKEFLENHKDEMK